MLDLTLNPRTQTLCLYLDHWVARVEEQRVLVLVVPDLPKDCRLGRVPVPEKADLAAEGEEPAKLDERCARSMQLGHLLIGA